MTAKVINKYTWNGKFYCNIQYGDGSCITLKSTVELTDEQWITKALALYDAQADEPDPMLSLLMSAPDQMLVDEVIRRHLSIAVSGEIV